MPYEPYGPYQYGRDAECIVADYLDSKGWKILISEGSRGPDDIIAKRGTRKWVIQVKSTVTRAPQKSLLSFLASDGVKSLKKRADQLGGTAVLAHLVPRMNVIGDLRPDLMDKIINLENNGSKFTLMFLSVRTTTMLTP